jgi:hypothetical protein
MSPGAPACWETQRDRPEVRLTANDDFFRDAERGKFCSSNWYEGHGGALGKVGQPPTYAHPAPALMGSDGGIHAFCVAQLLEEERARYAKGLDGVLKGGVVAKACVVASSNILNMVGRRVPYNLCRNLEWQMCAVKGRLPSQNVEAGIIFADAPASLEVRPWAEDGTATAGGNCSALAHSRHPKKELHVNRSGYSVSDVFYLEVCIFQEVCSNGADLFRLGVGESFHCKFSHRGFQQLRDLLLSGREAQSLGAMGC